MANVEKMAYFLKDTDEAVRAQGYSKEDWNAYQNTQRMRDSFLSLRNDLKNIDTQSHKHVLQEAISDIEGEWRLHHTTKQKLNELLDEILLWPSQQSIVHHHWTNEQYDSLDDMANKMMGVEIRKGKDVYLTTPSKEAFKWIVSQERLKKFPEHEKRIIDQCNDLWIRDPKQVAYVLATAVHESDYFNTMHEYNKGMKKIQDEHGNTTLVHRSYSKPQRVVVGNRSADVAFYGRWYIQLTLKANYEKIDTHLKKTGRLRQDQSIVLNPDLVTDPELAKYIHCIGMRDGLFRGDKLSDHISNGEADYIKARNIVNSRGDRAQRIAKIALNYEKRLAGGEITKSPQKKQYSLYKVKSWDNPSMIARKNGITLTALLKENDLNMNSTIHPNQVLKIPVSGR